MDNELKPRKTVRLKKCPFCGKQGEISIDKPLKLYWVSCKNQRCNMQVCTHIYSTKKAAIAAWNKRVN